MRFIISSSGQHRGCTASQKAGACHQEVRHARLSKPGGGGPALPSAARLARYMTKLAPVAAVGEMRWAVVALVLQIQSQPCTIHFAQFHP